MASGSVQVRAVVAHSDTPRPIGIWRGLVGSVSRRSPLAATEFRWYSAAFGSPPHAKRAPPAPVLTPRSAGGGTRVARRQLAVAATLATNASAGKPSVRSGPTMTGNVDGN